MGKRRSHIAVALLVALSLGACGQIHDAKRSIARNLIDPASVQWRDVRIVKRPTTSGGAISVVCGQLNARNQLGGMVGYTDFAYITKHTYPTVTPPFASRVLPVGSNDMSKWQEDDLNRRKNTDLDPFPITDGQGYYTLYGLCDKSDAALPSGVVDFNWVNPCPDIDYGGGRELSSTAWVIRNSVSRLSDVPNSEICRILADHQGDILAARRGEKPSTSSATGRAASKLEERVVSVVVSQARLAYQIPESLTHY